MSGVAEQLNEVMLNDLGYFKSWYDFYFNVERYLPDDKREVFYSPYGSELFGRLQNYSVASSIRKEKLGDFQLSTLVDFDINQDLVRFVVKYADRLKSISRTAGAIFCHKEIAKVIGKKQLDELVKFIGKEVYSFIVKRVLILGRVVPSLSIPNYPIAEKIDSAGREILFAALKGLPLEIARRLCMLLDEDFSTFYEKDVDDKLSKKCFAFLEFVVNKV